MQTVVLVAGEGTRMRPLTARRPKPLLPVAGRPLVTHTLDAAVAAGASRFVLVVGYEAEVVEETIGSAYRGVPVEYVRQAEQAGTADAVRAARPALEAAPFVVLAGDNLYDAASMAGLYESVPAVGTIAVADPTPYGVFELAENQVTGVVEKPSEPPSNHVNISAYAFEAAALDWLDDVEPSARGEYELTDVLAKQLEATDTRPVVFERWMDVGRPWELLEANEWKLEGLEGDIAGRVHESAELDGRIVVESGARVRSGATIEGPVFIGANAEIGPTAYVRGATAIGPGAHIGHGVEVKNSVVMSETAVPHLSYVGDSVLGRAVNFGAGTTVANLRHDDAPVKVTVKGERVSTGRRKFGVVVGDGAKTGIDTSLNAGVTLSADARTAPGEVVTRDR